MVNILIVGVGGIGSFLTRELNRLLLNEQIDTNNSITLADFDKVELKNIRYQNFTTNDIGKSKAKVLSDRYCFNYVDTEISREEQLKHYDFIVCCADNGKTRKFIFEYCNKTDTDFIDTRAEGRAVAIFTKHKSNTTENLIKTLNGTNIEKSKSCQLPHELKRNIIQQGNVIVATICSQLILNKLRGNENLPEYIFYF